MLETIKKVEKYIEENRMLNIGDSVIIGVSGGPDSMCLLNILMKIKKKYKLSLIAAHINHGFRGKDADFDQEYVKEYCDNNDVIYEGVKLDVQKIADERRISSEMAGREVRYEFFEGLTKKYKAHKIALAHNSNDVAETMLMRMIRGTGIDGLEGIKPVREGRFIRPILCLDRAIIEEYCEKEALNPRIDKTNLENIYSRNKIRLELIPYIKENFNEDITGALLRLARNVSRDNEYFNEEVEKTAAEFVRIENDRITIKRTVLEKHEAVITRVIRFCIGKIKGNLNNIEQKHIYDIIELYKKESGKRIHISDGLVVTNSFGDVLISREECESKKRGRERLELGEDSGDYHLEVIENNGIKSLKSGKYTKYFDYDKIKGNICLKSREDGDVITPLGMSGRKKLKKIFSENKIPSHERDNIDIIECEKGIIWIVGLVVSDLFKVDHKTKKILVIKFKGEK